MIVYSLSTICEVPIFFILAVIGFSIGIPSLISDGKNKCTSVRYTCAWISFGVSMTVIIGIIAHV